MTLELGEQAKALEDACHRLLLRPDDALARESVARTIAATELSSSLEDDAFVRGLVAEAQAHADSLAFRLEGVGYDCLCISATTAMLCQALAQLRLQLAALAARNSGEFGLRL